MGRVEENKKKKKEALFRTAYELFTTKGINSTAISDIVEKAGVAKGTFYLYFKDKYDIKNKLIAHKTKELFDHAAVALENSGITGLEDQLVFIIDDIINILVNNKPLLNFISKNLVMGALKSAFWSDEEADKIFYERYLELVEADTYNYKDIDIMLFTILELAGSTGYNSILFEEPVSIEAYKPFLYRTVRPDHPESPRRSLKLLPATGLVIRLLIPCNYFFHGVFCSFHRTLDHLRLSAAASF